jgi:hypothetical protein
MPKARRKRKGIPHEKSGGYRGTASASQERKEQSGQQMATLQSQRPSASRTFLSPSVRGPESLIFPALVALGCWGMVFYFFFLTGEANHILYGGMAVLMALLWTFSFGIRIRKLLLQRARM